MLAAPERRLDVDRRSPRAIHQNFKFRRTVAPEDPVGMRLDENISLGNRAMPICFKPRRRLKISRLAGDVLDEAAKNTCKINNNCIKLYF